MVRSTSDIIIKSYGCNFFHHRQGLEVFKYTFWSMLHHVIFILRLKWSRDQYQSACQYIRHFFALYVATSHLEKRMEMNFEGMMTCMKYLSERSLVRLVELACLEQSLIMSKQKLLLHMLS